MYQFFVEPGAISEKQVVLTGKDGNHIKNVLRMKVGEEIAVSNGVDGREYRCGILQMTEDAVICELRFIKEDGVELPSKIYLFQGLPKADKMELIIQKAVELGASAVVPVATKNAVVRLDEKKAQAKKKRWQAIAESAAKQSKRSRIPQVELVMTLKEAFSFVHDREFGLCLIPYEQEKGMDAMKQALEKTAPGQKIAVFIGPEGGFDEGEIRQALEMGVCPVSLGSRILRTETAGLAILSVLMMKLEGAF